MAPRGGGGKQKELQKWLIEEARLPGLTYPKPQRKVLKNYLFGIQKVEEEQREDPLRKEPLRTDQTDVLERRVNNLI
tara:strand:+ start:382 stop:612 length:231 start_codon:yes stop_codon:yes gene_type:complete